MNVYRKLKGEDLGILIGSVPGKNILPTDFFEESGILIYRPRNECIPSIDMEEAEFRALLGSKAKKATIPYRFVRQVENGTALVWRNRDFFALDSIDITRYDNPYWNRGNLTLEFSDLEGVEAIISLVESRLNIREVS